MVHGAGPAAGGVLGGQRRTGCRQGRRGGHGAASGKQHGDGDDAGAEELRPRAGEQREGGGTAAG